MVKVVVLVRSEISYRHDLAPRLVGEAAEDLDGNPVDGLERVC